VSFELEKHALESLLEESLVVRSQRLGFSAPVVAVPSRERLPGSGSRELGQTMTDVHDCENKVEMDGEFHKRMASFDHTTPASASMDS
jgi:hypothetical protein